MGYENWRFEWAPTSQPDDQFPVWENLTPWVETVGRPWRAQSGRPTEFDTAQPGTLALTLNNTDHRFSNLKLARQVRATETIGYRTFQTFRGWIELPDISDWAESGVDQFITVTAVDRMTRLDRSRKFISTMTEYIRYNGGSGLQAYYPLLESAGQVYYDASPNGHEPVTPNYQRYATVTPTQGGPALTAGNGMMLPGDDLAGPTWSPRVDAGGNVAETAQLKALWQNWAPQAGSDTVTLAAWVIPSASPLSTVVFMDLIRLLAAGGHQIGFRWDSTNGWTANALFSPNPPTQAAFAGPQPGMPMLMALRVNLVSQQLEVWRHADPPVTAAIAGVLPASANWNWIEAGQFFAGTISHKQVYVGDSTVYTRSQHLAQIQAGYAGLAGQTTGQRIRTLAAYAGVPAGQLAVDDGTVRMQRVSLAGKSPLTPMREAETTERGVLLANGAGKLVFADRIRRYNI